MDSGFVAKPLFDINNPMVRASVLREKFARYGFTAFHRFGFTEGAFPCPLDSAMARKPEREKALTGVTRLGSLGRGGRLHGG